MYNATSLTVYDDKTMIEKYQNLIQYEALTIWSDKDLKSLNFINSLNINTLEIYNCKNIIPKLESNIIKKLKIVNCKILSIKEFQLENLEVLCISNISNQLESKMLAQEINRFLKLKKLVLHGWIIDTTQISQMTDLTNLGLSNCCLLTTEALRTYLPFVNLEKLNMFENQKISITSLQQMTRLTQLGLSGCGLFSVDALQPLINLEELQLHQNKGINITSIQYLINLTKLNLESCNLVSLDALRPLCKLEELDISWNSIIYLQPIKELKYLCKLDARNNKIIDSQAIQQHINLEKFDLRNQEQPIKEQLEAATVWKLISSPITSLKYMCMQASHIKHQNIIFRKIITQQLHNSQYGHEPFLAQVALHFQKMNAFEDVQ
ncbi:DUF2252_family protein [Hexamita inflata]|uniref:DUF2252 family protein n=1 Tax=Hexamita inflata TaxID=28002 RepID=A0AA86TMZ7_9EUKA|nr:DUF2252 family protein [Hexamita inflata]